MSPSTILRRASRADLPRMTRVLVDAFAPGPWGKTLFPPHLKVKPGDGDEFEWRLYMISSGFDNPGRETVVACEVEAQGEEIVGWAQWIDSSASREGGGPSPEEMKAQMVRDLGANPAGLDGEAFDRLRSGGQQLEESFEEFLGTERSRASWHLNYLVVDPKHHRQGLGRLLAKEGLDRAASQGRDVCLRSTPEGRPLYLALGFEQIREQEVFGESQYAMVLEASGEAPTT